LNFIHRLFLLLFFGCLQRIGGYTVLTEMGSMDVIRFVRAIVFLFQKSFNS